MSIKYLNLSGLEDLWINIKNYILSKVPTKTSELTNDSGYLTSHQSLDNYVTLNSNQTITAIKTITGGNQGKMLFKNPNYTKGDAVESGTTISRLYFGNGASYATANGVLTTDINSAGNTSIELCAMNNTASNSNRASLILTYDKSATRPRLLKSWGDFIPNSNDEYSLGNASNIWKECYSNAYYLGTTAFGDIVTHNASEFLTSHQSLANYVTTNTDQSISGIKSHSKHISILGDYLGNEYSINARTCLYLKSNRDTDGKSGIYFSKFRQNRAQGALTGSDLVDLSLDVLENSVRTNSCISISFRYFENDVPTKIYVIPKASMTSYMGTTSNPWTNMYAVNIYENGTALSSKYAQVDNISANEIGTTRLLAYEPASPSDYGSSPAGTTKPGSSLYDVSMYLSNAAEYYGALNSGSGEFIVMINARKTQSGTWKILHDITVSVPQSGTRSFAISMWVRIA